MEELMLPRQSRGTVVDHTYLLRIWRADGNQTWRVTLRRADGSAVQHFPSLTALVAMLWRELQREQGEG